MGVFKRVRKAKDGSENKYWYIRYTINGRDKWESIGVAGIVTKAVAQRILAERKRQIVLGQYEQIGAKIPTLTEFEDEYLSYKKDVRQNRSWKRDKNSMRHLINFFGDNKLSSITPSDIIDYQNKRLKDTINNHPIKPATVNRELACLRSLFNFAKQRNKFFGENPVSKVKFLEENNQMDRILSYEEEERLLNSCPSYIKPIVITALSTGMRKMEILSLKWENVDLNNNVITIEATNSKTKKKKLIPISSELKNELLKQKLKTGYQEYVFLTSKGTNFKGSDSLTRVYHNACKDAGIGKIGFHGLRHTFATRGIELTGNVVAVSKILGHRDLQTTMRYVHPDKSLFETVERISNHKVNPGNK